MARAVVRACALLAVACRPPDERPPAPEAPPVVSAPPSAAAASSSAAVAEPRPHVDLPDVSTDWCLDGWRGLDESTCYLVPDGWDSARPTRLLVYFAGIVPPVPRSPQKEKVARIVAAAAKRARAVALLPRGRRGIGPADARDWWAWPTSRSDVQAHAGAIVAAVLASRAKLEGALGHLDRMYVAGSSSGAYFLSALALGGWLEADGWAAASGGAPGLAGRELPSRRAPFYVGYASADPTSGGPKALGAFLERARWPVRMAVHPGDHGAREVYLDEAFAYWAGVAP